ncbi:MAG: hypothetical protein A2091_04040 [Desulfuromonadales bacterium GWD2_61_12]|nr:MAG: hypothetical protein A2005_01585 [Desulfuromonadales bacterium GWC2_61_20]OGR34366.1 MAG: hypothetical protein A2091_04040 [Desulfuromonadales bacterium GWD2_61_12]HAD04009.1 hypothetical protein [Desulfuromonas sp.]HBT83164.1 hypothetical protein [Desulfuromonas sp.]
MTLTVKPSDLKFKYPRDVARRDEPKFSGLPDGVPFNRHDLYEILPLLTAVMEALESDDGRVLHLLEDLLNDMPRFVTTRGEVYNYLLGSAQECLRA